VKAERVVFRAPLTVEVEAFEVPETDLGPYDVITKTRATVISPGTELARLQGKLYFESDIPPGFPVNDVGYANIGTVIAAGDKVPVKPGDRVFTMGNHSSISRVNSQTMLCVPVPEGLTDEQAAFCRIATVSMTTMVTTIARAGDQVGIVGLGLVGNLAAQVFQAAGMFVNGFDLAPHRRELAQACGVKSVHGAEEMKDFQQAHRLVVECSGVARAVASAVEMTAPGGEIVMIGAPWGGDANSIPSSQLTRLIFFRFLRLRSGSEWEIPRQPEPLAVGSNYQNTVTALEWLKEGKLKVEPLITHRITPGQTPGAYDGLLNRPNDYLGVVIDWTKRD
jgi:2-desacetyl-2-hydroxyethyl bacteriochlorophyllide A dehydrogenase